MTQWYTDFTEYTAGVAPSDWTPQWDPSRKVVTIENSGIPSGGGAQAMKIANGTVGTVYGLSWDDIGTPTGDVEILMKWLPVTASAQQLGALAHGSGAAGSKNGYSPRQQSGAFWSVTKYVSNASSLIAAANSGLTVASNTWYWVRFGISGTTVRWRIWADGSGEPGSWTGSATDSALTSGWVGILTNNATAVLWIDVFSVGTGGDPAPDAPLGPTYVDGESETTASASTEAAGVRDAAGSSNTTTSATTAAAALRDASGQSSTTASASTAAEGTRVRSGESSTTASASTAAAGLRDALGTSTTTAAASTVASGVRDAAGASSTAASAATASAVAARDALGESSTTASASTSAEGSVYTPPVPDYVLPVTPRGVVTLPMATPAGTRVFAANPASARQISATPAGAHTLPAAPRGAITIEVEP